MRFKARIKGLELKARILKRIDPMVYEWLDYMYSNAPRKRSEEEIQSLNYWMENRPEPENPSPAYQQLRKAYGMV